MSFVLQAQAALAVAFLCLPCVALAQPNPSAQTPRLPRAVPKPGPVRLPILPALPRPEETSFYARTDVPHGKVVQATYKNFAGKDKRMHIYLPPDYDTNTSARYPVLYLNHGGGEDDSKWTAIPPGGGQAHDILDNLIAAKKAKPMIIVMPNTRELASPRPPAPGQLDDCSREYLQDIIPFVDKQYRTRPNRESRALAGLSMGGFVVMNTGLAHLDTFSELYVYSSGLLPRPADRRRGELQECPTRPEDQRIPVARAALHGRGRDGHRPEERAGDTGDIKPVRAAQLLGAEFRRSRVGELAPLPVADRPDHVSRQRSLHRPSTIWH